MPYCWSFR